MSANQQPTTAKESASSESAIAFTPTRFHISALIRITLLLLYIALTLPLTFLAQAAHAPISVEWLGVGLALGFLVVYGAVSDRVDLDEEGIRVGYPIWVPPFIRKGWSLPWAKVKALKPRTTGQGGLVYYFVSKSGESYLLPMRVGGFTKLVKLVEIKTGIDTTDIRPLAQPWMYIILLVFTTMLLTVDGWSIYRILNFPFPSVS
ncbi:hypothetical protein V2H45_02860 [Tumidithrix elongata RA019]|uniref:Uncharacterized protein n=1 Tax=Tumidithrix elongata BACA0141 TaxID=2716417 RepID=A0AAW9PT39_9CYAN|nr:hypothetical protein [Tumidithrix elongata RA019]